MKLRVLNRWRGRVIAAFAVASLFSMSVGCGSSDDELAEQEVGLEGETNVENAEGDFGNNEVSNAENANAEGEENFNEFGNNEFANNEFANNDASNTEGENNAFAENGLNNFENEEFAEGEAGNETEELFNNGANDSFNAVAEDPAAAGEAGSDPFASNATSTDMNGEAVDPFAANTAADPFASNTATDPVVASDDPFAAVGGDTSASDPVVAESQPAAAPVGGSASVPSQGMVPENGARMAYFIQIGDTLATIAQKVYGNASNWSALAQENGISDPNRIYAGDVLFYTLNSQTRSFAERYETAPRRTVTVQAGDTLSGLASQVFGKQGAWRSLWKQNPQISNPDVLEVGQVLSYREVSSVAVLDGSSLTEEYLAASAF